MKHTALVLDGSNQEDFRHVCIFSKLNEEYSVRHIYKFLYQWHIILNKSPCSLPALVEVSVVLATFAGLAGFAIPEVAGVDQGLPIGIHATLCGLGVAAEGLCCARVPGLAEIGP